jgi:hypothetical protein
MTVFTASIGANGPMSTISEAKREMTALNSQPSLSSEQQQLVGQLSIWATLATEDLKHPSAR